jgi:hypothetical protein
MNEFWGNHNGRPELHSNSDFKELNELEIFSLIDF